LTEAFGIKTAFFLAFKLPLFLKTSIMDQNFYSFSAVDLQGRKIQMDNFKDKVILVVNTASECGFTPQLEGLEELYKNYSDKAFVVLGFPCNQFGKQEPGDEKSIAEGCVRNYGVTFPMFSKVKVNGRNAHPLFKFLKKELGSFLGSRIKWNFTKFLIDRNGKPVERFAPTKKPEKLQPLIEKLIIQGE
jgi:glutathione peroxidase